MRKAIHLEDLLHIFLAFFSLLYRSLECPGLKTTLDIRLIMEPVHEYGSDDCPGVLSIPKTALPWIWYLTWDAEMDSYICPFRLDIYEDWDEYRRHDEANTNASHAGFDSLLLAVICIYSLDEIGSIIRGKREMCFWAVPTGDCISDCITYGPFWRQEKERKLPPCWLLEVPIEPRCLGSLSLLGITHLGHFFSFIPN